jgi:DHA2 family multidrug resistance protein
VSAVAETKPVPGHQVKLSPGHVVTLSPGFSSGVNPWVVAAAVVIPTFMEVLDTTIATVALRYIAGGLSAAVTDAEWVLTSYLAANATILPISGWLSARLGRRNYFLLSIAVFTMASGLCGMATSLEQIILFRVLQGLAGGGLQPSSQGVLLDAFPPEKQGSAQTVFGVAALLAPVIGPTLGGYLTVTYDWRWIFYINVPVGALALVFCYLVVDDPAYLKKQRAELRRGPLNFDAIGFGLLALAMASWEIMLSKGQEWDWLKDPFWRVQTLLVLFVLGLGVLIFRELRIAHPVVNFRPLAERNLAASCIIIFCAFGVLYAASTSLPGLLQALFNYDAYVSGLVLSPAGLFSVLVLLIVGRLLGRGVDARWLIAGGLLVMAIGCYWTSLLNLYISPWQVVWPRVVLIVGLSMIFAPLNVAAFKYTPLYLRGAAVGLFALLRNEGGSVGTSMAQTVQERRLQFHLSRLTDGLSPLNPYVHDFFQGGESFFKQQTGDPAQSWLMTLQKLDDLRQQQAASLAYFDVFYLCAALGVVLIPLVLLMKRSVAEKGAHAGAE